LLLPRQLYNAT